MRIIDAHTHVFPHYARLAVDVMDRAGVEKSVTLEWHDGFGSALRDHLNTFAQYPGRFIVFGNVEFARINEPDFATSAAAQISADVGAGMRGLKIFKALGLDYRQEDDTFWRIDDERLDPIWSKAAELDIPILIHTADPKPFWDPVDENNFWNGVLYGEYSWWTYHDKDYPSYDDLLEQRNNVIRRHSETTFICPHVGSKSDNLAAAAADLRSFGNLYYDISARIPTIARTAELASATRKFIIEFQDRILMGTDLIYDDTHVPTGLQAQCLYQPGEIPLDNRDAEARYVETSTEFLDSYKDFLTTDHVQSDPPFKRNLDGFSVHGLALPNDVAEKVLATNADRIIRC